MQQKLRSGYTTGTHATACLQACVLEFFQSKKSKSVEVLLPQGECASIEVKREAFACYSSIKGENDDIDVTKGAKITIKLLKTKPIKIKKQTPASIKINEFQLFLWAGEGVGVVTKKGLKIPPSYPAINPTPLSMMQKNIELTVVNETKTLHAVVSVASGEEIAKETANAKVGVIGGISILGTKGIVKPISATAYIDSIQTEIDVAAAQGYKSIVFTLGNRAFDFAKRDFNEVQIVEIGNFIYDALKLLQKHSFNKLYFVTSIAKMTKVAQDYRNTHNRYGGIDFVLVKELLYKELNIDLQNEEFRTLKAIMDTLQPKEQEAFASLISKKAALRLQHWMQELEVDTKELTVITLHNEKYFKEELRW